MDWRRLVQEIQTVGLSQAQVGAAIGRSQAWVADVLSGRYDDLKWRDGEALRKLHSVKLGAATPAPEPHQEAA